MLENLANRQVWRLALVALMQIRRVYTILSAIKEIKIGGSTI